MNRRTFTRLAGSAAAGAAAGWPIPRRIGARTPGAENPSAAVDAARLLERFHSLAQYGETPEGGISRTAYSDADIAARESVAGWLEEAGLSVSVDFAGNLVGRREGTEPGLKPLVMGSHIDSVPDGGNFDGQVGSAGAVEAAAALHTASIQLRHPLEVVIFANEEGGKTGSRAWAGQVRPFELSRTTASGFTIGDGTRRVGGDPDRLAEVRRDPDSVAGFLELHIEQGGVLEQVGTQIGVVEGIVGIRRWTATVTGVPNHAGTTPMGDRRDALLGAAELALAVNDVVTSRDGTQVGTVGVIRAQPGAPNVIPGQTELSIEIRDLSMDTIDELFEQIRARAEGIAERRDLSIGFVEFYVSFAAPTEERFRRYVESAANQLGLSHRRMPSGAGHDAQSFKELGPIGMIFVPSVDGVSHSPREKTHDDDIVRGTQVLLGALLQADAEES